MSMLDGFPVRRINHFVIAAIVLAFTGLLLLAYQGLVDIERAYQDSAQTSGTQATVQRMIAAGLLFNSARGVRFANPADDRALASMERALVAVNEQAERMQRDAPNLHQTLSIPIRDFQHLAAAAIASAKAGPMPAQQMQQVLAAWRDLRFPLDEILEGLDGELEAATANFETQMNRVVLRIIIAVGSAAVLITGLILFASNRAGRAFRSMEQTLNEVARGDGDLTKRLKQDDNTELSHMGAAFNLFAEKVQGVVRQVLATIGQLRVATEQMAAITNRVNQEIHHQQSESDQVATAMNEMAATVQDVAKHASSTAEAARIAHEQASEGRTITENTRNAMSTLANEITAAAEVIHKLEQESVEIGGVLDVIRSIAEQTNLLALNAAIEAARAGEQGRGFAVVADEVRTLASRTQASTSKVREMIDRLQAGAIEAVKAMESGQKTVDQGVQEASAAGTALATIYQSVSNMSDMNLQIASAAEEQSAVAEEINRNIVAITQSLEGIVEGTRQTADAGNELSALAVELQKITSQFKV